MSWRFFYSSWVLALSVLCNQQPAFADHPGEGSLTLAPLIAEAEAQNLELQEADASLKSTRSRARAAFGRYLPSLSLEGGPLLTRFADQASSGTSYYGKIDWNLYRGGADRYSFDSFKIRESLEERKFASVKAKVGRDVARLYYELLFLLESKALKEKAIELNQEQMALAKRKKTSGFTSSADVIEFELREATLNSDLQMLNQQLIEQSRQLSVVLGRKDSNSVITVKGHLKKVGPVASKETFMRQLDEQSLEIATAKADVELSERDRSSIQSRYLPSLDLEARYGKIAVDERVLPGTNNYAVFLKLSVPIFSGLETLNESRAINASLAAKEASAARAALTTRATAENLFSLLKTISDRIALEEKTLPKSETYYKITLDEYRRGVKNSPDMVGASERLLDARIRNLEFRRDFFLAELKLYDLISEVPSH
ncbi:MAG: TolC family protein [Bdellovibrionales bacterium]|nr:TolC family protein [Bdellovibrionales bacterium]